MIMHREYIRVISVFTICLHLQICVVSNNAATRTTNNDLNKAFLGVTNKSGELINLIPEMYDLNVTNAPFIFKVPIKDGSKMIYMQRSDFVEPQFPMLSTNYINLMKERKQITAAALVQELEPQEGEEQYDVEGGENNEWDELGLVGWVGEISRPIQLANVSSKNRQEQNSSGVTLKDLKLEQIVGNLMQGSKDSQDNQARSLDNRTARDRVITTMMEKVKDENERNSKVYIARANDPFGYSTSWELRNSSELSIEISDIALSEDNRLKRDIVKLYSMIKCSTGCEPIKYKGYGCYCGFLGAGIPVNGIDTCCKLHDKCYEYSNCISYLEYFVPYIWKCYRGKPLCAIDHGKFGGPESCAARLCHCDLQLSRCLKRFICPRRRIRCRSSAARQLQNLLFF